ncbi:MAG: hypothetical protein H9802_02100 [Candidatus Phocaeicola faecipullorum]|nr:hypothetical protein [Candidatus Phocaeicola faecipullorum]
MNRPRPSSGNWVKMPCGKEASRTSPENRLWARKNIRPTLPPHSVSH